LEIDFWEVYMKLSPILEEISSNADQLLEYQRK